MSNENAPFPDPSADACPPAVDPNAPPDCTCEEALAGEICTCIEAQTTELVAALEACCASIVDAINAQTHVDVEYICDEDLNTWQLVTFVDGVETSSVDTGVSCDDPKPMPTQVVRECRDGVINIVFYTDPTDGTIPTELSAVPTAEPCDGVVTIDNTCDNPVPVVACEPLEVVIVGNEIPVVEVDTVPVCNEATGLIEYHQTTTTDGVPAETVVIPTAIACVAEPVPVVTVDVEFFCNTDTGVYDQITITTTDGVVGEPVITPTTTLCVIEPEPVVTVDVEYVCNEGTGVYDEITTTTTDGVPADPVVEATTIPCDQPEPVVTVDVEYVCNEDTGVYDEITTTTTDGVPADPVVEATTIVCVPAPEPVVTIDIELVCNADTGVYDEHIYTTTDGVTAEPVITPTTISCVVPEAPDFEQITECRNGTVHTVTSAIDADGVITEISAIDTGQECEPGAPECVKWQSVYVQMDNTGTTYKEAIEFNITNTDGSVDTFTVGPVAGWSDQVSGIAAAMDGIYSGTYDPRCTILPNGCGGLLPPPADAPAQPGIFARYINGVHCPTDIKIPVKATATRASGAVVDLPFYVIKGPEYRGQVCRTCDNGAGALQYEDGSLVAAADLPVCLFDCAEAIPEPPLAACQFDTLAGNWCDLVLSGDPDVDDTIVQSEIVITISTCGSEQSASYSVIDADGALEPYEPQGIIVDCETGEEPFVEPPPCPEGAVFECVEIPGNGYGILDNSLWNDGAAAPANHLQNGNAYEIELTKADGSTMLLGPLADPYFNTFMAAFNAAPGCKVLPVCANHTSPKGCAASHVANLAAYPAYDAPTAPGDPQNNLGNPALEELWATGWLLDCAGCESPIVRAEIVGATDPAWIGVAKDIIVHEGEPTTAFRSLNCEGVFWKDCDGNDIPAPTGGCCATPCAAPAPAAAIDAALIECCPEGGGAAVEYVRPEPQDTEQSYGIGDVIGDGTGGIKFDTASADISPELRAAHQAIIDCINDGGVANTVITDQDGNTVELDLDVVGGDGNPQYFYGGTVVDGDPGSGKLRGMTVTCSVGAACDTALRTVGCNDDRRDDKLDTLIGLQTTTNDLLQQLIDCLCGDCPECPPLDIGTPAYTSDASPVSFPTEACSPTRDYGTPISFGADAIECLTNADPGLLIRVRWSFDHEVEASTSHSGFNVSVTGGASAITPVATSSVATGADIGAAAPHSGVRADYWADFDIPLGDLLSGVVLQTSAFGTTSGQCETIHSQNITISPDDVNLSDICDC